MNPARTPRGGAPPRGDALTAPPAAGGTPEPAAKQPGRLLPPSRYRHPGDVIRLIAGGLLLVVASTVAAVWSDELLGPGAPAVHWLGYDPAGRVLVGLVQVMFVITASGAVAAGLRYRRFRLLAGLAAGTGVGLSSGAAVSAVLTYRLATYWLPVVPGWISLRFLQRRDYL
jgi:glycosyltransferase 2 family protein